MTYFYFIITFFARRLDHLLPNVGQINLELKNIITIVLNRSIHPSL